jgi:hypothetical protein
MPTLRNRLSIVTLLCLALVSRGRAQESSPAPLPPPPTTIVIDDQLIDVTDAVKRGGPMPAAGAGSRSRFSPNGVTVDSDLLPWALRFSGWDGGVIPIEFGSDVTAAQRDQFLRVCATTWGQNAQVLCVPHTSQNGYLRIAATDIGDDSGCFSSVGQFRRLVTYELHLGPGCWFDSTIAHELGHAFGFIHEHQRPNRDQYLSIDLTNVPADKRSNFTRITSLSDPEGPYDFLSIMHYAQTAFASDRSKPTMIPNAGYSSFAGIMGTSPRPTDLDYVAINHLYNGYLRPLSLTAPLESPHTQFDRNDFLDAMERLHAFYTSRMGLNRPAGLSIGNKPDFQGVATWVFDIYLAARSRGYSAEQAFGMVVADITQSSEWRGKHPGQAPLSRPSFTPVIGFDRAEFLDTLNRLDAFYQSADGLKRPDGLSISGGPDFVGIATWLFDVYLNERLRGSSATVAWTRVVNAIQATDEWRRKH